MPLDGSQLGRYRLIRLLGRGGMGEVYLAEDTQLRRQVAVKTIQIVATQDSASGEAQEAARLFQREARAIAALNHPHILPLFDFGEDSIQGVPLTYMVMPFCPEDSLATWLRQGNRTASLSLQDISSFVQQAADGLQHAHNHQVVHQDVKPSNFLIRSNERTPNRPNLMLADFGVARVTSATTAASQSIRGTPAYMAPEQWNGSPGPASDQYSLAVMTYELLTGRPPFQGTLGQIMYQHLSTQARPPSSLNARIPPVVDLVLRQALAKDPQERFLSVSAFAHAFEQALESPASSTNLVSSQKGSDIRATLAISPVEVQTGTTRTLTLPGGRRLTVSVPQGAYQGQMIQLEGQGEPSPTGGPAGTLLLTLTIQQAEEGIELPKASSEPTMFKGGPTFPPNAQPPSNYVFPSNPSLPPTQIGASPTLPTPLTPNQPYTPNQIGMPSIPDLARGQVISPPRRLSTGMVALLIALALLVVGGGVGSIIYFTRGGNSPGSLGNIGTPGGNRGTSTTGTGGTIVSGNGGGGTNIKVATELPVSGADASLGTSTENGAHLAVDQANANSTIPGYRLQFVPYNDVGVSNVHDPATGANNVTAIVGDALIAGFVGPFNSNVARAEMPIANRAPIANISPSNTNPCLTQNSDASGCSGANDELARLRPTGHVTYFRIATTDDHQGPAGADYLFNTLHYKSVYVIDDTETYGVGLAKYFIQEWTKLGGTVIDHKSVRSTNDYTQLLTVVAAAKPDVVYYAGNFSTGGTNIREQMQRFDALKNTPFAGGDGIEDDSFAQAVGLTGGPIYASVATADASQVPAAQGFIAAYRAKYGTDIGPYSAVAYDAMNILIQAIKKVVADGKVTVPTDSNDSAHAGPFRQAVIDAIQGISYDGALGHTTFDSKGDTTNKVLTIYQVADLGGGKVGWKSVSVVTIQ